MTNGASINVTTGSNITTIGSAATVKLSGANSTFAKINTLTNNQGTFHLANDRDFTTAGNLANSGTVRIEDSTTALTIGGSGVYTQTAGTTQLVNGGSLNASGGVSLQGGMLIGVGTVNGNVTTSIGSTSIGPGASPGLITINGNLSLHSGNTLNMELGGTTAIAGYDLLDVNGNLNLAGLLNLQFVNGFESLLTAGSIFTIVTADTPILGSFSNVASGGFLFDLGNRHEFNVYYGAGSAYGVNNVTLVAITPEPARTMLLFVGLSSMLLRRRRPRP